MTARKCLYIQGGTAPNAVEMRAGLAAMVGGRNYEALSPATGAIGRGHGVLAADALQVTAQASPNDTVLVAPGMGTVRGTQANDQGSYLVALDNPETLQVAPKHASLTRIDYVVAQVKDDAYAAFSDDIWEVEIVEGTAGAGAPAVPEDCLVLAQVTVAGGAGSTVVTSGNITDLRPHARATGGITPVATTASLPNPQDYDVVWDISTSQFKMRLGGAWVTIGKDLDVNWTSFTPTWTNVTLGGSGAQRYGRWFRIGRLVLGHAGFQLGSGGEVTGTIQLTLPTPADDPGGGVRYMGAGRAFIGTLFYSCTALIDPAADATKLTNFATAGVAAWNATQPVNWADVGGTLGQLRCFFNYEAAS